MSEDLFEPFKNKSKMNEVTRRLFEESKEIRKTEWGEGEGVTYVNYHTFAKLIIEEADRVVSNTFWSHPHEVYQAMELIRKHFGVE